MRTRSPAASSAAIALSRSRSTTLGTVTGGGPLETTSSTVEPFASGVPAFGLLEMTSPESTLSENRAEGFGGSGGGGGSSYVAEGFQLVDYLLSVVKEQGARGSMPTKAGRSGRSTGTRSKGGL